jgi:glycosyltransferase involved in cell wall biosynthesis
LSETGLNQMQSTQSNKPMGERKLLVLDSSYSLETIRSQKLEDSVTCRDLNGFFERVWTVHPFATLVTSEKWTSKFGKAKWHSLTSVHTFIEGKIGRFVWLKRFAPLNFFLGQISIFAILLQLIRKERISVIRVGNPLYLGLLGWALSRCCGIPLVVRVGGNHDKIYETTGQPLEKRLFFNRSVEKIIERFVFARADLVAGANQDNLDFALANGARPEFSTLFRYGNLIDKRHFVEPSERGVGHVLLEELGAKPGCFIVYIGRLESVKHPDDVVRVLAEVRRRGRDVKVLLAGDGQLRPELAALARELRVEDKVLLCGNRDQEWLAQIIPLAAAVVSPHTGRALSEAALGSAPIVAYDVDWQGELIETGITGELVPHLDWMKMADALDRFLEDPAYAHAMGDAVRKRIVEMMDPAMLDQHERDQYTALLHRIEYRRQYRLQFRKSTGLPKD